ncbi:hypothetical protein CNR22_00135 [Sphingobacteriaceae bacterium]|nr:hypothetical protein CNR22_00135 [Sphingobacteriaceae bacterium]
MNKTILLEVRLYLIVFLFFSVAQIAHGQCSGCTITYASNTAANVTINSGQTVCVNAGVTCSGIFFLNGGTLCNSGTINNLKLTTGYGTIHNFGIIRGPENLVSFSGNVAINCYPTSQLTCTWTTVQMNLIDSIFFNLYNDSRVTFSNGLIIGSKKIVISNGNTYSGAPANMNVSIFKTATNFIVDNAVLRLTNTSRGRIEVGGDFNLSAGGNKTVRNDGVITTTAALNISGSGGGSANVNISNMGALNVGGNFDCSLTSGTAVVTNGYTGPNNNTFIVGGNVSLSAPSSTVTNANGMLVTGDMLISGGSFVNDRNINVSGKIQNTGGTIQNNYMAYSTNFVNTSGTSNNVGFLSVATTFSNNGGTLNLGKKSTLSTTNYYNIAAGSINGPSLTSAEILNNDYGRIIIQAYSQNSTAVTGFVQVFDLSLNCSTSLNNYGFDLIQNPSSIGSNVLFTAKCFTTTPGILCTSPMIDLTINEPGMAICPGDSVVKLGGKFGWYLCLFPVEVQFNPITAGVTCTWQPGNVNTMSMMVTPTVTTVYTLSLNYQNCTYVRTVTVTVRTDCPEEIIGCCLSNYGAAVWVNDATTYLNVYCNLINEVGYVYGVQGGFFESRSGTIRVLLNWIHNGKNSLYYASLPFGPLPLDLSPYFGPLLGVTSFFGGDQKIKGNSKTYFNNLSLDGNGTKSIWIDEVDVGYLNLSSNILGIQNYLFSMKEATAAITRTGGYATTDLSGYFSRKMATAYFKLPYMSYLFPLGASATATSSLRYRPLVISINSPTQNDEISANFMNVTQSSSTDPVFVNTNTTVTNNINSQSPSVIQINHSFYHKIKHTDLTPVISDLALKSYYATADGYYQSISEWEKNPNASYDWWGTTPGSSASTVISSDPGTAGLVYAQTSGTLNFQHSPFSLAKGGFYINTNAFAGGSGITPGSMITVTATNTGGGTHTGGGLGTSFGTGSNSGNNGGGGNTVFAPTPVAGTYVMNITPPNTCAFPGKIKFVIDQNGNISPATLEYGVLTGSLSSGFLGQLSEEVYTIDQVNTGLILKSSPRELLKSCVNSVTISTTTNADYVLSSTITPAERIEVKLPTATTPATITYGQFKIYDAASYLVPVTNSNLAAGTNTIIPSSPLVPGVYRFELLVTASSSPPLNEIIKGQFIVK